MQRAMKELEKKLKTDSQAAANLGEVVSKAQLFDEHLPLHHELFAELRRAQGTGEVSIGAALIAAIEGFHDTHVGFFLKAFSTSLEDDHPENVYMEREWRKLGNLEFELADVARVLLPTPFAIRLRDDIPEYIGQVHFTD
jgi:hypothetical protein